MEEIAFTDSSRGKVSSKPKSLHELLASKKDKDPQQHEVPLPEVTLDSYELNPESFDSGRKNNEYNTLNLQNNSRKPPPPAKPRPNNTVTFKDVRRDAEPLGSNNFRPYPLPEEDGELEMEMPSSTILVDDSDIMSLLGTPVNNAKNNTNTSSQAANNNLDPDIIEFYSTIAFLKKENSELMKELEFTKKSKEAIVKDLQQKSDQQINKLKNELRLANDKIATQVNEIDEIRKMNELIKEDFQGLLHEKEDLEIKLTRMKETVAASSQSSSDQSALRNDLMNSKTELNKLKMEMARNKNDYDRIYDENTYLKDELSRLQKELDNSSQTTTKDIQHFQNELRKAEEQVSHYFFSSQ